MEWAQQYDGSNQPTKEQISSYIQTPLWEEMNAFLKDSYQTEPTCQYSRCSAQPGWNIKYRKAGRSLCTLYPMQGFFIAMVVIGNKEQAETELLLPVLSAYTQKLYADSPFSTGGRWLMMHVTDEKVMADAKALIQIRRKIKPKKK